MIRLLGALPLGDVGDETLPEDGAVGLPFGLGRARYPAHGAAGEARAVFAFPAREGLARMADRFGDPFDVFRMNEVPAWGGVFRSWAPCDRSAGCPRSQTEKTVAALGALAELKHHAGHLRGDVAQPRVEFAPPLLREALLGDIARDREVADDPAPAVAHRRDGYTDRDAFAVTPHVGPVAFLRLGARLGVGHEGPKAGGHGAAEVAGKPGRTRGEFLRQVKGFIPELPDRSSAR